MGRYYSSKKTEADGLKKIQNWWLKKHGYFKGNWAAGTIKWTNSWSNKETSVGINVIIDDSEKYLRIYYTRTDEEDNKTDFDYKIPLTTTPCYFGGVRYWFTCPWYSNGAYCGRRVGTLYLEGKYFACRHCYDLSYSSRNKSKIPLLAALDLLFKRDEIIEKQEKLRVKQWRGQPTKKYLKLEEKGWRVARKAVFIAPLIDKELGVKRRKNSY